jgi:hypothetical protein
VLTAGALLNVATAATSQSYQQAAEADRASVVLAWHAAQGALDAMLATGGLLPAAVPLFGSVLRHGLNPVLGWGTVAVGTAGIAVPSWPRRRRRRRWSRSASSARLPST